MTRLLAREALIETACLFVILVGGMFLAASL